jgi:hypothetical protein
MQEKKNKKRLILLAVLTAATLFVFWWIQPENRLDIDHDVFLVEDLTTIDRVDLVTDTSRVTLVFDGGSWRVNDRYRADADMVRVLFATLQQARPKRTVAKLQQDSILNSLEESGVKVSLYENGQLREEFYAGGNASETQAFFADPESGEVYVMTIPGYRVYVSGIFELEESAWRDKFVFGFNWRNFKNLAARFPKTPSENFTVSMDRDYVGIVGLPQADTDTAKLNTFLDDVSLLAADAFISEPGLIDSLKALTPIMEITVSDIGNRMYELQLFDPGSRARVLGLVQGSQVALFDRRKIGQLLRPKSFFIKK